jgi:hypothetical protein
MNASGLHRQRVGTRAVRGVVLRACAVGLAGLMLAACGGCVGTTIGPSNPTAFTPPKYVEHRVLFAQPNAKSRDVWDLKFGYQLDANAGEDASGPEVAGATGSPVTRVVPMKPGDPISIVVSDVYLPKDFSGTKDVVVLLDIHTSQSRGNESYAVWYQRGVVGGQKLAFDSLLVYSDRAWSPLNPPRFTLRVVDVSKERNEEARRTFEGLNSAIGGLASFIPNPAMLGAATAIKVAGLVLGNRANVTIIDFTPQFFSPDFIRASGANDLPLFAPGQWMVVGRAPKGSPVMAGLSMPEDFWKRDLQLDRRSGVIYDVESGLPSGSIRV